MDRARFESQKAFAGEKKPSMQRRSVDNDYTARRMYMITMVTEERKPLFGKVVGRSEAVEPGGKRMEACASGQLLILAPWEHHNEKLTIKRGQCLQLNEMARKICEGE